MVKKESYDSLVNKYLQNYLIESYEKDEDKKEEGSEDDENVTAQEVNDEVNAINAAKRKPVDRNKVAVAIKAAKNAGISLKQPV